MAHAYFHARSSARRFGGALEDYLAFHEFMDATKAHLADARHRLFLHNAWGIFFVERIFGATFARASDGKIVPLRPILEQHVFEDLGHIPSLNDCFRDLPARPLQGLEDDDCAHSEQSAASFGGDWCDYLLAHQELNRVREILPDGRHQRLLHNAWGVTLLLRLFGTTLTRPSDGVDVSLRPVLEEHIRRDLGRIPLLHECAEGIELERWMYQAARPLSQAM